MKLTATISMVDTSATQTTAASSEAQSRAKILGKATEGSAPSESPKAAPPITFAGLLFAARHRH